MPAHDRPACRRALAFLLLAVGAVVAGGAPFRAEAEAEPARRPKQEFVAPAPGSYRLQVIQQAPDGEVIDTDRHAYRLERYLTGRITLLSFMYTYCVDPIACPLAFDTFRILRARLLEAPNLARRVRFVSLSFDPVNDTPDAMRNYAGKLADPSSALRWHFLTTRSVAALSPIVADLGQDVALQLDARGQPTRLYDHLLKIFLIDERGRVREIYTTAFLLPEVMLNDIRTLATERQATRNEARLEPR